MQKLRLTLALALLAASFGVQAASALTVDNTAAAGKGAASNLMDPDNKIPYPHVADDGTQPSSNFQAQPVGNSGVSFSIVAPSGAPADNAFQRAQERMQQ